MLRHAIFRQGLVPESAPVQLGNTLVHPLKPLHILMENHQLPLYGKGICLVFEKHVNRKYPPSEEREWRGNLS